MRRGCKINRGILGHVGGSSSARIREAPLRLCNRIIWEMEEHLINNLEIGLYLTCLFKKSINLQRTGEKEKKKKPSVLHSLRNTILKNISHFASSASLPLWGLSLCYGSQCWNYPSRDPLLLSAKGGHLTQGRPLRLLFSWDPQSEKCVLRKAMVEANFSWDPFTLCMGRLRLVSQWAEVTWLQAIFPTNRSALFRFWHLFGK